ncbi:hypothetical protein SEA_ECLIPTUS_54 [Gordonia phage Ecliptus]|nr:hypothetical protein SEA_ECLIPTUS_54 [Gordonia phage Ecliptus]
MSGSTFDHGDRVIRGMAHWEMEDQCNQDFAKLKDDDRFAWVGFCALIEDATKGGVDLDESQVRCPLDFAPPKVHEPPWMGEFKVVGKKNGKKHWRLYFGEPINHQDLVVGVDLWHKLSSWTRAQTKTREADAIAKAMGKLKWHFGTQGYVWSPLHPD